MAKSYVSQCIIVCSVLDTHQAFSERAAHGGGQT
jgi:hypothetical protein